MLKITKFDYLCGLKFYCMQRRSTPGRASANKESSRSSSPGKTSRRSSSATRPAGLSRPGIRKKAKAPVAKAEESSKQPGIRLNRYIAQTGLCSRREADELIRQGLITVNGKLITELGTRVMPGDEVRYNGQRLHEERKVYVLLNKPKDYTTTTDDPYAKKTVMELVKNACKERIYPVGRLDRSTTGVLLLTNDGELAKKLTHPKFNKKKVYHVFLDKKLKNEDFRKIAAGIELEDGPIRPDALSWVDEEDKTQVGIEIHSGRNRIVRRIFEHLGYRIKKLDRVYFAGLTKKGLPRGHWRFLTDKEIKMLKMGAFE